jgi:hypothetical protein
MVRELYAPPTRDALQSMVEGGALRSLDDLAVTLFAKSEDEFSIPVAADIAGRKMGLVGLGLSDALFSCGQWPWQVWSGVWCTLAGKGEYATQVLRDLRESDDCGPLAWWMISRLYATVSQPHARAVAALGLQKLDRESFLADCRALLEDSSAAGKTLRHIAHAAGQLQEDEARALGQLLADRNILDDARLLEDLVSTYRRNAHAHDALQEVLGQLWERGLATQLKREFLRLRGSEAVRTANSAAGKSRPRPGETVR